MSAIIKPSSGGHWYGIGEPAGNSFFGVEAYDKTLRDARKEVLVPSVTTVLKEKSNPGLDAWKREQMLLAALTLPEIEGESTDDRIKRIISDSEEHSRTAAETGDIIHKLIERGIGGEQVRLEEYPDVIAQGVRKTLSWLYEMKSVTEYLEQAFVSMEYGYGCRVDWAGTVNGIKTVIDFKTQGTKPGGKTAKYPTWCYQLAANGMAMPKAYEKAYENYINIIISSTEPERPIEIKIWSAADIQNGWDVFYHLLQVFTLSRKMGAWSKEQGRFI